MNPIRPAQLSDAAAICRIYNHYVLNTHVTFEESAVGADEMGQRLTEVTGSSGRAATSALPWLVLEENGEILGYTYASKWKGRCAYRFTVESTVYLQPDATGRGHGAKLYAALLDALRARGLHSVIGGIALPNPASQRLHERAGFKKVAHFEQVGWKFDRWIDVGYWELIL